MNLPLNTRAVVLLFQSLYVLPVFQNCICEYKLLSLKQHWKATCESFNSMWSIIVMRMAWYWVFIMFTEKTVRAQVCRRATFWTCAGLFMFSLHIKTDFGQRFGNFKMRLSQKWFVTKSDYRGYSPISWLLTASRLKHAWVCRIDRRSPYKARRVLINLYSSVEDGAVTILTFVILNWRRQRVFFKQVRFNQNIVWSFEGMRFGESGTLSSRSSRES